VACGKRRRDSLLKRHDFDARQRQGR
jgi:hypothetical protein